MKEELVKIIDELDEDTLHLLLLTALELQKYTEKE
jgi:hypothetical protein